jgi:hypothetical protein
MEERIGLEPISRISKTRSSPGRALRMGWPEGIGPSWADPQSAGLPLSYGHNRDGVLSDRPPARTTLYAMRCASCRPGVEPGFPSSWCLNADSNGDLARFKRMLNPIQLHSGKS